MNNEVEYVMIGNSESILYYNRIGALHVQCCNRDCSTWTALQSLIPIWTTSKRPAVIQHLLQTNDRMCHIRFLRCSYRRGRSNGVSGYLMKNKAIKCIPGWLFIEITK